MPDTFEVIDCSVLSETLPKTRTYTRKSKSTPVIEKFEVLDSEEIAKFEPLPDDFKYTPAPRPHYVNSRDEMRKVANRPIIFIDGEGANDGPRIVTTRKQILHKWVQKQNYALLGVVLEPDEYRCIVGKDNVSQLSTIDCFNFILSLPENHIIVGFALTYDVEMWLRDIPAISIVPGNPSPMERLMKTGALSWKRYRIHYIPKKLITIGKYKRHKKITSRTVYDSHGFFQSTFKDAIRKWSVGTPEEWSFIDRMKEARPDFGPVTEEVKAYNRMEGIHGVQLFSKVRTEYTKLGLALPRPVGAGSIASAMFRKHGVLDYFPQHRILPIDIMLSGFYGGRADCTRIGFVGDVAFCDINSAYPHIARNLPCLRCGQYIKTQNYDPSPHSIWLARWKDNGTRWSPFPYRSDGGSIRYYSNGLGWYYDSEISAALRFDPSIEILEGYRWSPGCDHTPFGFIEAYYERRQELLRIHDFGEIIIKLGLNSVYGKLAQSKGSHPTWQQLIWAGLITSGTRAMLLDGIRQTPDNVLMVATDSIFSRTPLQLNYDEVELGAWKSEELYDLLLLGNGVYQSTGSSNPKYPHGVAKNRGFNRDASYRFDWSEIRENYKNGVTSTVRRYEFRRFVKAVHEKALNERCDWIETEVELKLDVAKKKRMEGELIYPLPNPTPNVASAPAKIRNLNEPSFVSSLDSNQTVSEITS